MSDPTSIQAFLDSAWLFLQEETNLLTTGQPTAHITTADGTQVELPSYAAVIADLETPLQLAEQANANLFAYLLGTGDTATVSDGDTDHVVQSLAKTLQDIEDVGQDVLLATTQSGQALTSSTTAYQRSVVAENKAQQAVTASDSVLDTVAFLNDVIMNYDLYTKKPWVVVDTIADRNAIPYEDRWQGMLVVVTDDEDVDLNQPWLLIDNSPTHPQWMLFQPWESSFSVALTMPEAFVVEQEYDTDTGLTTIDVEMANGYRVPNHATVVVPFDEDDNSFTILTGNGDWQVAQVTGTIDRWKLNGEEGATVNIELRNDDGYSVASFVNDNAEFLDDSTDIIWVNGIPDFPTDGTRTFFTVTKIGSTWYAGPSLTVNAGGNEYFNFGTNYFPSPDWVVMGTAPEYPSLSPYYEASDGDALFLEGVQHNDESGQNVHLIAPGNGNIMLGSGHYSYEGGEESYGNSVAWGYGNGISGQYSMVGGLYGSDLGSGKAQVLSAGYQTQTRTIVETFETVPTSFMTNGDLNLVQFRLNPNSINRITGTVVAKSGAYNEIYTVYDIDALIEHAKTDYWSSDDPYITNETAVVAYTSGANDLGATEPYLESTGGTSTFALRVFSSLQQPITWFVKLEIDEIARYSYQWRFADITPQEFRNTQLVASGTYSGSSAYQIALLRYGSSANPTSSEMWLEYGYRDSSRNLDLDPYFSYQDSRNLTSHGLVIGNAMGNLGPYDAAIILAIDGRTTNATHRLFKYRYGVGNVDETFNNGINTGDLVNTSIMVNTVVPIVEGSGNIEFILIGYGPKDGSGASSIRAVDPSTGAVFGGFSPVLPDGWVLPQGDCGPFMAYDPGVGGQSPGIVIALRNSITAVYCSVWRLHLDGSLALDDPLITFDSNEAGKINLQFKNDHIYNMEWYTDGGDPATTGHIMKEYSSSGELTRKPPVPNISSGESPMDMAAFQRLYVDDSLNVFIPEANGESGDIGDQHLSLWRYL